MSLVAWMDEHILYVACMECTLQYCMMVEIFTMWTKDDPATREDICHDHCFSFPRYRNKRDRKLQYVQYYRTSLSILYYYCATHRLLIQVLPEPTMYNSNDHHFDKMLSYTQTGSTILSSSAGATKTRINLLRRAEGPIVFCIIQYGRIHWWREKTKWIGSARYHNY